MDTRTGELGRFETMRAYVAPEDLLELNEKEFQALKAMSGEERVQWAKERMLGKTEKLTGSTLRSASR